MSDLTREQIEKRIDLLDGPHFILGELPFTRAELLTVYRMALRAPAQSQEPGGMPEEPHEVTRFRNRSDITVWGPIERYIDALRSWASARVGRLKDEVDTEIAWRVAAESRADREAKLREAALSPWSTPSARDHKDTPGMATERPDGSRERLDQLEVLILPQALEGKA